VFLVGGGGDDIAGVWPPECESAGAPLTWMTREIRKITRSHVARTRVLAAWAAQGHISACGVAGCTAWGTLAAPHGHKMGSGRSGPVSAGEGRVHYAWERNQLIARAPAWPRVVDGDYFLVWGPMRRVARVGVPLVEWVVEWRSWSQGVCLHWAAVLSSPHVSACYLCIPVPTDVK